jgi:two-component system, chemotaxis family, chemotaxis protein CheY
MPKILIVDNSLFIRTALQKILEDAGHTVVGQASNGKEALHLFLSLRPDVVTLDLVMDTPDRRLSRSPEESASDGLNALQEIRARDPKAVILVVTAGRQLLERARALGAAGVIFKPLNADQVLQTLLQARLGPARAKAPLPPPAKG